MEEYLLLFVALAGAGVAALAVLIVYQTVWKPRQRRALERKHFRSKLQ